MVLLTMSLSDIKITLACQLYEIRCTWVLDFYVSCLCKLKSDNKLDKMKVDLEKTDDLLAVALIEHGFSSIKILQDMYA